jgi:hypothetical protein
VTAIEWLLKENNLDANADWKPYFCDECPLAGEPLEPNFTDRSEAYFPCLLLKKSVWGETPLCTAEDWRRTAKQELAAVTAALDEARAENKILRDMMIGTRRHKAYPYVLYCGGGNCATRAEAEAAIDAAVKRALAAALKGVRE